MPSPNWTVPISCAVVEAVEVESPKGSLVGVTGVVDVA